MAQKNTSRYEQIRGDFSVYSVDSVWKLLHADVAELRRHFAKLCAFAWEERYVLLFLCQKFCLTLTEIHRICSTYLHVSARKNSHAKAQRARSYLYFCSYVKNRCTQKSQKYTETLLRMLFCESLRRLRETIPLRTAFCEFRGFRVNPSVISNSCAFVAQKKYKKIRAYTWRLFCVFRRFLCETNTRIYNLNIIPNDYCPIYKSNGRYLIWGSAVAFWVVSQLHHTFCLHFLYNCQEL